MNGSGKSRQDWDARARLELLLAPGVVDAIEQLVEQRLREALAAREAARFADRAWLTLQEAGQLLGCSPDAVRMRVRRGRRGQLESRRHGRRVYVSAASVGRLSSGRARGVHPPVHPSTRRKAG